MVTAATGRRGQVRWAVIEAVIDAAILGVGITTGWFVVGDLLIGAWLQTLIPLISVPVVLLTAGHLAPDTAAVRAPGTLAISGLPLRGKRAATAGAVFFILHYGAFSLILGVFVVVVALRIGVGPAPVLAAIALTARAALANVPTARSDAGFLASDGYRHLATKTGHLMGRPYTRIAPLIAGILIVMPAVLIEVRRLPEVAIGVVLVAMTVVASLWRYPEVPASEPPPDPAPGPPSR